MKQTVQAGVLDKLVDMVKSISSLLGKGLDYLYKIGIEMDKPTQNEDGSIEFDAKSPMGNEFHVICKPAGKKDYFDLEFTADGETAEKVKNIKGDRIHEVIKKVAKEWWGEDVEVTKASNSIQVGLRKVTAGEDVEVQMTAINCDTDIPTAVMLIDTVLNNDEFVDTIPEEETFYEIADDGDDVDLTNMEEFEITTNAAETMLAEAINLKDDLQYIHWNARGRQFNNIHEYLNGPIYAVSEQIDYLAEACVEFYGHCPHSGAMQKREPLNKPEGYSNQEGFQLVRDLMHLYIDCLELFYCNFESDFQSILDDWIRYWKKEADYFIARRLIDAGPDDEVVDTTNV